ncbi:MAG TPA: GNAT family N-acetyltransferase [Candidatus Binatia bacterium]|nr:GNAT family N-acetyltransferase [Candidatus Binatia bacterium]
MRHHRTTVDPTLEPPIPGLRLRPWAGDTDAEAVAELKNRAYTFDRIERRTTGDLVRHELRTLPGFDLGADLVLAELDGRLVALARHHRELESDGTPVHWLSGVVDPDLRGRGIGRFLLHRNLARARAVAAAAPSERPPVASAWLAETEAGAIALLEGEGFRPVRSFFDMVRPSLDDLPLAPLPEGLEIRPATPETARRILEADAEAFRDHWGHTELTDEDVRSVLEDPDTDLDLWQVAWHGDEVAGVVIVLVRDVDLRLLGRRRGWLDDVAVRRPWRRRGLATALMVRAMAALRARGLEEAALGVDAENPSGAVALYERLGFRKTMRYAVYRRPLDELPG